MLKCVFSRANKHNNGPNSYILLHFKLILACNIGFNIEYFNFNNNYFKFVFIDFKFRKNILLDIKICKNTKNLAKSMLKYGNLTLKYTKIAQKQAILRVFRHIFKQIWV